MSEMDRGGRNSWKSRVDSALQAEADAKRSESEKRLQMWQDASAPEQILKVLKERLKAVLGIDITPTRNPVEVDGILLGLTGPFMKGGGRHTYQGEVVIFYQLYLWLYCRNCRKISPYEEIRSLDDDDFIFGLVGILKRLGYPGRELHSLDCSRCSRCQSD